MNKFVKGAKNLAFVLSFVTVAACGNVKKAELEALEERVNNKLDGVTKDGQGDKNQGYARKSDVDFKIANGKSEVLKEIENVKGKMISKEDVINANVKSSGIEVANLERLGVDLKGEKFMVSVVDDKVVVKRGGVVVFEEFKVATGVAPIQFIADVVSLKGEFIFDESFKPKNRIKFDGGNGVDRIKVGDYVSGGAADTIKLVCLLGEIGVEVFEKFFDRNESVLGNANLKVAGQFFSGVKDVLGSDEEKKKKFGAGLGVLFGVEGEVRNGGASEASELGNEKLGFVLSRAVGNVKCVPFEANA